MWDMFIAKKDDINSVRIRNHQYWLGPAYISTPHNGHKGQWFDIEFFDGRNIRTCDLWYRGEIPLAVRDDLPDNAKFKE